MKGSRAGWRQLAFYPTKERPYRGEDHKQVFPVSGVVQVEHEAVPSSGYPIPGDSGTIPSLVEWENGPRRLLPQPAGADPPRVFPTAPGLKHIATIVSRPAALVTATTFVASLLARTVWLESARFHPDESSVLWMALVAVRHPSLPDHGLVSSYLAFQPPGLVWVTMPFVWLGGGNPAVVIIGLGALNAVAAAFLVWTVARNYGLVYATVLGAFLTVGPDAPMSAAVWHPSLYPTATCLMLAAAIRLRTGSSWWAAVIAATPGVYALIHYSGFALYGPAIAILLLARRRAVVQVATGLTVTGVLWVPFLVFAAGRHWVDFSRVAGASEDGKHGVGKLVARLVAVPYDVSHLGQSTTGAVLLTPVLVALVFAGLALAVRRRAWLEPGFLIPAAMIGAGLAAQIVTTQGGRLDVLTLWLVPLYMLAGWTAQQATRNPAVIGSLVAVVLAVGAVDLARSVGDVPAQNTLAAQEAHVGPVAFRALQPQNRLYLACDPPYGWGAETMYLSEVRQPGEGRIAAERAGAFKGRSACR